LIALLLTLFNPLPSLHIFYLIPPLVRNFYRLDFASCIGWAMGAGLLLDLLSSAPRLGLYAFLFSLIAALLYPLRKFFFEESLMTLPILTTLWSFLVTLGAFSFHNVIPGGTDLLLAPLIDGFYAFALFTLPRLFRDGFPRSGKEYFSS